MQNTEALPKSRTRTRGLVRVPRVKERRKHIEGYNALDDMEDESDASTSGGEWDGGDDDEVDDNIVDDEEDDDADMSESGRSVDELDDEVAFQPSLVVSLRYHPKHKMSGNGLDMKEEEPAMINGSTAPPTGSIHIVDGALNRMANGNAHPSSNFRPSPLREMSSVDNSEPHTDSLQGAMAPLQ